jgi:hypothetical protein
MNSAFTSNSKRICQFFFPPRYFTYSYITCNIDAIRFYRFHLNLWWYSECLTRYDMVSFISPLGSSATIWIISQPRMIDDECGAVGGMRIGRGDRSTRTKLAAVPLCPPQIPHDLKRALTRPPWWEAGN